MLSRPYTVCVPVHTAWAMTDERTAQNIGGSPDTTRGTHGLCCVHMSPPWFCQRCLRSPRAHRPTPGIDSVCASFDCPRKCCNRTGRSTPLCCTIPKVNQTSIKFSLCLEEIYHLNLLTRTNPQATRIQRTLFSTPELLIADAVVQRS